MQFYFLIFDAAFSFDEIGNCISVGCGAQTKLEARMSDGLDTRNAGFAFETLVDVDDATLHASDDSHIHRIGTEGLGELLFRGAQGFFCALLLGDVMADSADYGFSDPFGTKGVVILPN